MINITAIQGSPRKRGNTDTILDAFIQGANDAGAIVSKKYLVDINVKNCKGCTACYKKGVCVIQDELTPIFSEVLASDILVLASPIYSMTVTADLKTFIDRGQFLWAQQYITKTRTYSAKHFNLHTGVYISTSGTDNQNVFDAAFPTIRAFFHDAGFSYNDNLLYPGMDKHGGAKNWSEAIISAKEKGRTIVETQLKKLNN